MRNQAASRFSEILKLLSERMVIITRFSRKEGPAWAMVLIAYAPVIVAFVWVLIGVGQYATWIFWG